MNWKITKLLRLSLAILLAMLGLVGLAGLGFDIPGLRQIIGFIFLTFIPGILIIRILKVHNISIIESLAYSVGLSIAFVMFTGLFMNFVFPLFGISRPISTLPVTATLAIFTLLLCGLAYKRDKDFASVVHFDISKTTLSPPYLFLILLPLLAILGALLVNYQQNNILLLIFIPVVAMIVGLVAFNKFIPEKAYPLAIVMIAISLLLHISLISNQLMGWDINTEYYFQNLVLNTGYWDYSIPHTLNTCLSLVILAPIYSLILNMDAIWLYKIIYPLFFCLVPLALFHTYREQIGVKRAFFSAFFFMAMITFFGEMTSLARQEVAELYFALVILLMIDRRLTLAQRTILTIIFATALIVSHYALGLFFTAFLLIGWVWLVLVRSKGGIIWKWLTSKFGGLPQSLISDRAFPAKIMVLIVVIYLAFALVWYGGIAQGYALHVMKSIGSSQYSLLSTEALNLIPTEPKITEPALTEPTPTKPKSTEPKTTEPTLTEPVPAKTTPTSLFVDPKTRQSLVLTALGLDFFSVSPLGKVFRVFQYITELFIIVGFIGLILKPRRFKGEYIALTMVSALILFLCIVMPRFSSYLNVTRFYHITLFLLSPLCILGGEAIWRGVSQLKVKRRLALSSKSGASGSAYLRFLALGVLIPYFLFNTGFFFEVTGSQLYGVNDSPSSWALTSYRLDMPVHNQREVAGTKWLSDAANDETKIYADQFGKLLLHTEFLAGVNTLTLKMKGVPQNSYAYLTTLNIERNEAVFIIKQGKQVKFEHISFDEIPDLFKSITNKNLTYNNGGAQIFSP